MWSSIAKFGAVLSLMLSAGCDNAPVEWSNAPVAVPTLDTTGAGGLPEGATLPSMSCPGSVRAVRSGAIVDAVWWMPRADSSARLEFARSTDGGAHWTIHSAVDSTDKSVVGCRRAPASIAADSASGYIHVSYGLTGTEGPGLFFSHSMDKGALFHSPVPIVYGEHLGATAVASSGDNVAVAFEDPNGTAHRVGLALSRTMGHIFEHRVVPVSDDNGAALLPMVALQGNHISVAWRETSPSNAGSVLRIRSGILR